LDRTSIEYMFIQISRETLLLFSGETGGREPGKIRAGGGREAGGDGAGCGSHARAGGGRRMRDDKFFNDFLVPF
jgi:hypothetical protein